MKQNPASIPERKIDDFKFRVDMLDLETAEEVFVRVARGVGPSIEELAKAAAQAKSIADVDVGKAASALSKFLGCLNKEDIKFLREAFAHVSAVQLPGTQAWVPLGSITDTIFRGKLWLMTRWLQFAFAVNFADFLKGVRATGLLSPTPPESSQSPSESPTV